MTTQIVTVGDNVVDCYPDLGVMYPGGNTVNVAVHVRRLKATSGYIGAVGTDAAGELVHGALLTENVDCSRVRKVHGPNARAYIRLEKGNRAFIGSDPGVSIFTVDAGDLTWMHGAAAVHTGECSGLDAQLPELHALPGLLSYDFSIRPMGYVAALAPHVDVAILSYESSHASSPTALARQVQAMGPQVVAVTIGANGAIVVQGNEIAESAAPHVDVVDTLGAGDAFIARLLVGIVRGESLGRMADASTAYASQTCSYYGAFGYETALPNENAQIPEGPSASSEVQVDSISTREFG